MEPDRELYFKIRDSLDRFARVYNRLEVYGEENIPAEGGALVCSNHDNYSDPFYIGAAVRERVLHFLAWHGIAEMPLVGPLFKRLGVMHSIEESLGVALDREQAKEVLGGLTQLLADGELVAIFPEGEIKHWIGCDGEAKLFKPGAARMAAMAGVPIIPVGITGTRWVCPNVLSYHDFGGPDKSVFIPGALPSKVRVKFGPPFHVNPAAAGDPFIREEETDRLRETIVDLAESIKPRRLADWI